MPIKPGKDESQTDWMARCVPDMKGDNGGTKRPQEQAVAACLTMWRDAKGGKEPADKDIAALIPGWISNLVRAGVLKAADVEYADPGYRADGGKRYRLDSEDRIRAAWHAINKSADAYTPEQARRIKARVVAAWKDKIDKAGPPSADDKASMDTLRGEVVLALKFDCPDPDDDEAHDDFIDRCTDEVMGDDPDRDEDEATQACQLRWDEQSDRGVGDIVHKTHATPATGMEFILSDASADRFGDIIDVAGWDISNFVKNPVALFNHDKGFVIGKWENLRIGDDLRGHLVLAPKGTSPRIDEIRRLVEADILRATSVGFRPVEHTPINAKDPWSGTHYLKHELVECSVVAVPANVNALAVAKSLNVSPATVRLVFGEHADNNTKRRSFNRPPGGEHAEKKPDSVTPKPTGEHAEIHESKTRGSPMLLSKRITDGEKRVLVLQDQLDAHLASMDDDNPTDEQMLVTEDLTAKIEMAQRHLNSMKAIEAKNGSGAEDVGEISRRGNGTGNGSTAVTKAPQGIVLRQKKPEPLDYFWRAALVKCKARADGQSIDDTRRKIYGDDEATRAVCDIVLKAASAPALTTVSGWAAELVQQIYADFMQVLLPLSVYPKLAAAGMSLTFGNAGRIIIPTRNLTPSLAGSFVGEGMPIPVRQGAFASQVVVPKKVAVITTWTKELDEHSIPAIEGLLRQAVLEDTAIAIDAVLLDNNPATAIRPNGLRVYQAGLTATVGGGFNALVGDLKLLQGSLLTLTQGNVRKPVIMLNPQQVLSISLIQPPAAATELFPFRAEVEAGRLGRATLIESSTVPLGMAIAVDAADFVSVGSEGPRLEISDQATLHMEDTTPQDIVGGSPGVAATPVKSMWQTDSLALRLIMLTNWIMRRPVVAWMTGVTW
jgi:HK97 family phage prohead protease